jgi:hypothetical protein
MSAQVEEVRLSLGHIELAAHLFGPEDGLPVIALHGWLDNANSFARLAPQLKGLRIVALDLAGHGYSEHRPPAPVTPWPTTPTMCCGLPSNWAGSVSPAGPFAGRDHFGATGRCLAGAGQPPGVDRRRHPPTGAEQDAAERLGMALQAQLRLDGKRKSVYATLEEGVQARMKGMVAVSREAAELLAQRGLMPVPGGYSWRSDSRLTLPSPVRLTRPRPWPSCAGELPGAAGGGRRRHAGAPHGAAGAATL